MPERHSTACFIFAVLAMVFTAIDATAGRDEETQEFGTDPAYTWYPDSFMAQAIEDDVGLQDAVEQAEFEDWKDTRLYGANQPANASYIYRELEEELF